MIEDCKESSILLIFFFLVAADFSKIGGALFLNHLTFDSANNPVFNKSPNDTGTAFAVPAEFGEFGQIGNDYRTQPNIDNWVRHTSRLSLL